MTNRDGFLIRLATQSRGPILLLLLALLSTPARAVFQGVAGEALLIPFALYDSAYGINTVVNITVPDRIGVAVLPNQFTAQHTSPADEPLASSSELTLRWFFFNSQGWIRADGQLKAIPNSLLTLDWGSLVKHNLPHLAGEPGYLVIQTKEGEEGQEATFTFFGHARMTFAGRSASIPVIPLSDGQDDSQGNGVPTLENEVVGTLLHAPLAAGIRTGSVDDSPGVFTEFDLIAGRTFWTLGYGYFPYSSYWRRVTEPTLLVVWNEGNPDWISAYLYDTDATYCSFMLPLNKALNVYWVSPPGVPSFGPGYFDTITPCSPWGSSFFSSPAYVRVVRHSPQQDAASVAFSIVFSEDQANITLARERGRFEAP